MSDNTTFLRRARLHWVHSLVSAFIGGGASAVSAALSAVVIDPAKFNFSSGGAGSIIKLMAVSFLVSGTITTAAYLKQSPLPPDEIDLEKGEK